MDDRRERSGDRSPPTGSRGASFRLRGLAVVIVAAALAYFALRTSPYLQYIPWMPRPVGVWADSNGILRNAVAFFIFAGLVFLLVGRGLWHVLAACAFGAGIEVAQLWIPGRVFDWRDIVASIAGVLCAWPLVWLLRPRRP